MTQRIVVSAACLLAALTQSSAAQQPAQRSTTAGVYTEAQATRGKDTYSGMCLGCHSAGSHNGASFLTAWGGRPLWELYGYISERMPKNEPGSLPAEEYAQVVSYLLKLNGMPAGALELPTDSLALKAIRFDTAAATAPGRVPAPRGQGRR